MSWRHQVDIKKRKVNQTQCWESDDGIPEKKDLHNRMSKQISSAMELLMSLCGVDANVWLTRPWVNQNLRDSAARQKSLSLPLSVELMIHTHRTVNLRYFQRRLITMDMCCYYLNINKSLSNLLCLRHWRNVICLRGKHNILVLWEKYKAYESVRGIHLPGSRLAKLLSPVQLGSVQQSLSGVFVSVISVGHS